MLGECVAHWATQSMGYSGLPGAGRMANAALANADNACFRASAEGLADRR